MTSRIFVISLPGAGERRALFAAAAVEAGLPWQFFDAHERPEPPLRYDPAEAERRGGRALLAGELGCYSSHAALWRRLIDDADAEQYIVLEDDVIADWEGLRLLHDRSIGEDGFQYLRLFHKHPGRQFVRRRNYRKRGQFIVELTDKAYGTQGYVLTKSGAAALLKAASPVIRPVDDHMDRYWERGLPNLAVFPALLIERTVASSIGDGVRNPGRPASWRRRLELAKDRARRRLARLRLMLGRGGG